MSDFKIPLRDIRFARNEVLKFADFWADLPGCEEATPDIVDAILEELAKFCENELATTYRAGDEHGCQLNDGEVTTPPGFKEAYAKFIEAGWPSLTATPELGGQGLPESLGTVLNEALGSANWAWSMYTLLGHGAKHTLEEHGSEEQKDLYLKRLIDGSWMGTMCLTEPHAGSDVGLLRTKAEPNDDGSYTLTGTKIFISAGEHDMSENIVHIVLARTPDAPAGTKGISLFIVPKFIPDADGNPGERNSLSCGSIEHKMGIHGCATCVMNFDGAKAWIIGEPNTGLRQMFTFMNSARLGVALQGLAHAERALQFAVPYAQERLQMRSLGGPKNPDGVADPIIVHPDVRRMLLTIKSVSEGSRLWAHWLGQKLDVVRYSQDEDTRKEADDIVSLCIPIAKAWMTELGIECASHAIQVFGGHGYISEWGVEQNMRDARIATIYEGTTQIQALDLLGRKVLGSQGEMLKKFTKVIHKFCQANEGNADVKPYIEALAAYNKEWGELTMDVGGKAMENPEEVGAAAVDYLMYSGYVCLAYFWALAAVTASETLAAGTSEENFYRAKLQTCDFYFKRMLPRAVSHRDMVKAGLAPLNDMAAEDFLLL